MRFSKAAFITQDSALVAGAIGVLIKSLLLVLENSHNLVLSCATKQAIQHTSTQKASEEDERERGEEKANLFENQFRSAGEENERQMENNVVQEM